MVERIDELDTSGDGDLAYPASEAGRKSHAVSDAVRHIEHARSFTLAACGVLSGGGSLRSDDVQLVSHRLLTALREMDAAQQMLQQRWRS
jgi:hypothetical protein